MAKFDIGALVSQAQQETQLKIFEQYVGVEILEAVATGNDFLIEHTIRKYEYESFMDRHSNDIDIQNNQMALNFLASIREGLFKEDFKTKTLEEKITLLLEALRHLGRTYRNQSWWERKKRGTGEQTNFVSSHMRRLMIELLEGSLTAEELMTLDKVCIRNVFKILSNPNVQIYVGRTSSGFERREDLVDMKAEALVITDKGRI